ncbi:hypothetical protein ACFL0C_00400 [Patescibacteria group bacterium]
MKKLIKISLFLVLTTVAFSFVVNAGENFSDDYEDGVLDGYTFINGNWWIEDGVLRQSELGDGRIAFVDNQTYKSQVALIDTKVEGSFCYSGLVFWYKDAFNSTSIDIDPLFNRIRIIEKVDGVTTEYPYSLTINDGQWYNLFIDANSDNGQVHVLIDGIYQFTFISHSTEKEGDTGVFTGCGQDVTFTGLYSDNLYIIPYSILTDENQCKDGGWEKFTEPSFKNQGDCISFFLSNVNALGNRRDN